MQADRCSQVTVCVQDFGRGTYRKEPDFDVDDQIIAAARCVHPLLLGCPCLHPWLGSNFCTVNKPDSLSKLEITKL